METNFLPIRVSTLRGDQPIDFDTYVKINDRFILYLRKGDSFEGLRLKRLKEKRLKKMFISPIEESLYRTYLARNIAMAYDPLAGKSLESRCEIIQGIQQSSTEAVFENPESPEHYLKAKDDCERFVKFLGTEPRALGIILGIDNMDKSMAHHGTSVATLATGLAQKLGAYDTKQLQILSLGALLHDLEHFNSAIDIARPLSELTASEMSYYKTHPVEGAHRVQSMNHFDAQVIKIIAQHEEFMDGGGFPNGLTEKELEPMSLIVSTANAVDRLISFENVPRSAAVKKLTIQSVGKYPLKYIQILGELLA